MLGNSASAAASSQEISILLVDGDSIGRERLQLGLSMERFQVSAFGDSESGLYHMGIEKPSLVILRLPPRYAEDDEVTRRFREATPAPLIVLADEQDHWVQAENLRQGADYVLPSSVSLRELRARIRALAWRSQTPHLPGRTALPGFQDRPVAPRQAHD